MPFLSLQADMHDNKIQEKEEPMGKSEYAQTLPKGGWWIGSSETPDKYQEAMQVVEELLKSRDEDPYEFYVTVTEKDKDIIIFHLWHKDAFKPENRRVIGNPGGRCRDIQYHSKMKRIINQLFWQ